MIRIPYKYKYEILDLPKIVVTGQLYKRYCTSIDIRCILGLVKDSYRLFNQFFHSFSLIL